MVSSIPELGIRILWEIALRSPRNLVSSDIRASSAAI